MVSEAVVPEINAVLKTESSLGKRKADKEEMARNWRKWYTEVGVNAAYAPMTMNYSLEDEILGESAAVRRHAPVLVHLQMGVNDVPLKSSTRRMNLDPGSPPTVNSEPVPLVDEMWKL